MGSGASKPSTSSSSGNRIMVQEAAHQNTSINYTQHHNTFSGISDYHNNNHSYNHTYHNGFHNQSIHGYGGYQGNNQWQMVHREGPNSHFITESVQTNSGDERQNVRQPADDRILFETLHCHDGKQYVVLNQGGRRFYLDSFENGEWQPLSNSMLANGYVEGRQEVISDSQTQTEVEDIGQLQDNCQPLISEVSTPSFTEQESDGNYGSVQHPVKGKIATLHVEERHNVHYYFNKEQGIWVRMPIELELHSDAIKHLISQMQETLPNVVDKRDILSVLRSCNYSTDEAISTYFTNVDFFGEGEVMSSSTFNGQSGPTIQAGVKSLEKEVENHRQTIEDLKHNLSSLEREKEDLQLKYKRQAEEIDKLKIALNKAKVRTKTCNVKKNEKSILRNGYSHNFDMAGYCNTLKATVQVTKDTFVYLRGEFLSLVDTMKSFWSQILDIFPKFEDAFASDSGKLTTITELYQRESVERRLLYNQLQELRGNIKVFLRCRMDSRGDSVYRFLNDQDVVCPNFSGNRPKTFRFDRAFPPQSTQEEVYAEVKPLIASTVDGYNVCIMAYGQTGSGKTYTMMGPRDNPGVNIRAIRDLLQICQASNAIQYVIRVSLLEVYNEMLRDLLVAENSSASLDIHVKGRNVFVKGILEMEVQTFDDVISIIDKGEKTRSVAETKMNSSSSRSHLIFIIRTFGTDSVTKESVNGTLTLVDLAGSERLSRTEATGQRLVEAAAINKSLTSLGQVFTALRTNALHVPYRNSKLTHLLQSALGSEGKACLFVNVSPLEENISESQSTLHFGSAARQVQFGKAVRNVVPKIE